MNMSEETLNAPKEEVSLWQIFLVFAKLGAFTIGGGYAMIPLIRDEMIKRDWMTDEELPDIIAISRIVMNDGITEPSVAITLPFTPWSL